ncbi:hypothetical protein C162_07489 [Paenibacillus sp. FSL R7-269]|uniref:hypothetical protein n=1 Tax=Paenibacillus sp. FSL R7-269 TaxID=1226755 RepID=UPI0003E26ED5|nr:hypothetical protein [Paenibacillus sp. FSL R7-269]ETT53079.1 hypothetical protein C162_07489 [Paenibacillus sp. FSL R7-269]
MRKGKGFLILRILVAVLPFVLLIQNYGTTIRIWLHPVTTTIGQVAPLLPDKEITTLTFIPGNDAKREFNITGDDDLSDLITRLSSLQIKEKNKSNQKEPDQFDSIFLSVQGGLRVMLDVSEDKKELLLLKVSKDNTTTRWYSVLNQEEMEQIVSLIMAKRTD